MVCTVVALVWHARVLAAAPVSSSVASTHLAALAAVDATGDAPDGLLQRNEEWLTAIFEGHERDALLFVPDSLPTGSSVPLVFNYHGFGGSAEFQRTRSDMNAYAESRGFAAIYPNGLGERRSHNGGSCCSPANEREDPTDDVGLATLWVERVIGTLPRLCIRSSPANQVRRMQMRCVDTAMW
jgi:poly(3-hydroxybutyrate) depolymerase